MAQNMIGLLCIGVDARLCPVLARLSAQQSKQCFWSLTGQKGKDYVLET